MNPKELVRDAERVHACLQELPDGSLVALKQLKIYIPARFAERSLAEIGVDNYIVGIFAIVTEDNFYGVSLANARIKIDPTSTLIVKVKGIDYLEFMFEPGSKVITSVNLVKDDILVYQIYDEIISKGRIPWYCSYEDLGHIFDSAIHHAGANIGENPEVTELLISIIARNPEDKTQYYRSILQTEDDLKSKPPAFIALRSVNFAATNTTDKLAGSYFNVGVVSALNSPSERTERIETLLRK